MVDYDLGYRDLNFEPTLDQKGDISVVRNKEAVKQALTNITQTARGTRIMRPGFGAGLERWLFEPLTVQTGNEIAELLGDAITSAEPRVQILEISATLVRTPLEGYNFTISYNIIDLQEVDFVEVQLNKL